jgi:hypothetical protein
MKRLFCLGFVMLCVLGTVSSATTISHRNTINAILGDGSFVARFSTIPTPATDERLRIQTHLEYVERLLRAKDVSFLPQPLRERRTILLDKLREYRLAGSFPTNIDFLGERRPCFIDAYGNICAVGYLIEQTAGRGMAVRINTMHKNDFLLYMVMPELSEWVKTSGLTARECAMIQPSYGPPRLDSNFKVVSITPSTTAATGRAYTMKIQMVGLRAPFLTPSSSSEFVSRNGRMTIDFDGNPLPYEAQWATSATMSNRWNAVFTLPIPPKLNTTAGTYPIVLNFAQLIGDGYYTTTTFTITTARSVQESILSSSIPMFPNPCNDAITLMLPRNELYTVHLTNALGLSVATLSDVSGTTRVNMNGLSAGFYFVEVCGTRYRSVQRVVKY